MSDSLPEHGIQQPTAHHDPHGHGHTMPLPFTDDEWEDFQKSDIVAGKMIVILFGGIFVIGLILYTTIAGIAYFDYGPLA